MEFLDTNILVYAHDEADQDKRRIAGELVLPYGTRTHRTDDGVDREERKDRIPED